MPDSSFNSENIKEITSNIPVHLTDEEKETVQSFRNFLFVKKIRENLITGEMQEAHLDGPFLTSYKIKWKIYQSATSDYNQAKISFDHATSPEDVTRWSLTVDDLSQVQRSANNDWIVGGYKNEIEIMISYINQVTNPDNVSTNRKTSSAVPLQFSNVEKEKIEKFRNLLYVKRTKKHLIYGDTYEVIEEAPMMITYKEKMQNYLKYSKKYREAETSLLHLTNAGVIVDGMDTRFEKQMMLTAHDEWITSGYKNEVEEMSAYINQVTQRSLFYYHY
ncbi:hypothetical protein [Bacillus toyonensis]|uniref:hypothetical protein n=1 Tax=Bacillus toyonensis TaxID=155322 RepID=UPI000BEFD1FE|nr:hypothetical protein [Bacillus toyonensis]PEO28692.1 hypothetical protein CN589_14070 [Bacillus toyonensis]PFY01400.1 hypothetical protein COL45_17725 [Bacillus toyonensis]PHB83483.1 hypothetical protein COE93_04215 [Bacillus toyonensis]